MKKYIIRSITGKVFHQYDQRARAIKLANDLSAMGQVQIWVYTLSNDGIVAPSYQLGYVFDNHRVTLTPSDAVMAAYDQAMQLRQKLVNEVASNKLKSIVRLEAQLADGVHPMIKSDILNKIQELRHELAIHTGGN